MKKQVESVRDKITSDSLLKWHKWLAGIQAIQGLIILLLATTQNFPITTEYVGVDALQTQAEGHTVTIAGTHHLFDLNITWVVAIFLFITALASLFIVTKFNETYVRDIKKGINKVYWLGHSLSSGVMLIAIALLSGVYDFSSLFMIFILTVVAGLLGLAGELYKQKGRSISWFSYTIGCVGGFVSWLIVGFYLLGSHVYASGTPRFVYWVFVVAFITNFVAPMLNTSLLYRKKDKWANYLYGERMYMILTFISETALAWQIFGGKLHP